MQRSTTHAYVLLTNTTLIDDANMLTLILNIAICGCNKAQANRFVTKRSYL